MSSGSPANVAVLYDETVHEMTKSRDSKGGAKGDWMTNGLSKVYVFEIGVVEYDVFHRLCALKTKCRKNFKKKPPQQVGTGWGVHTVNNAEEAAASARRRKGRGRNARPHLVHHGLHG